MFAKKYRQGKTHLSEKVSTYARADIVFLKQFIIPYSQSRRRRSSNSIV